MDTVEERAAAQRGPSSPFRSLFLPRWRVTLREATVLCALSAISLSACVKEKIEVANVSSPEGTVSLTRIRSKNLLLPEEIKDRFLNSERKPITLNVEAFGLIRIENDGRLMLCSSSNDSSNGLEIFSDDARSLAALKVAAQEKTTPVVLTGVASMETKTKNIKISVIKAQLLDTTEN